jgi:uncharacterized protein YjiS (DUF1127 family)
LLARLHDWTLAIDRRYRDRISLAEMDDHMLRDIGLTREDVQRELRRDVVWRLF